MDGQASKPIVEILGAWLAVLLFVSGCGPSLNSATKRVWRLRGHKRLRVQGIGVKGSNAKTRRSTRTICHPVASARVSPWRAATTERDHAAEMTTAYQHPRACWW